MNNDHELVIGGILKEALKEASNKLEKSFNVSIVKVIDDLARIINKSFEDIESRMATMATKEYVEARFDGISHEIKEIRSDIKAVDVRKEVINLEVRVDSIERQIKLKA